MEETKQEIITVEQFADRMNISRSTAYNWLAKGHLTTGRHVIIVGGVKEQPTQVSAEPFPRAPL